MNPHGCDPLDPKSSASANSATLARQNSFWNGLAGRRSNDITGPRRRVARARLPAPQGVVHVRPALRYRRAGRAALQVLRRGSRASRIPSPRRLKPSTARKLAMPRKAPSHGCRRPPRRRTARGAGQAVGQDVEDHQAPVGGAQRAGRPHEVVLLHRQHLGAPRGFLTGGGAPAYARPTDPTDPRSGSGGRHGQPGRYGR